MNIKKNLKRISLFLSICMMVLLFPLSAAATSVENAPQITIKYPLSDVTFDFYKVADFSTTGVFELEERFEALADEITDLKLLEDAPEQMTADKWRTLSVTLESYVYSHKLKANFSKMTDEEGNIVCAVEEGLYLLIAEGKMYGNDFYTPPANLAAVPNMDVDGKWQNQIVLDYSSKVDITPVIEQYTVQKIWAKDEDSKKDRPEKIVVDLYMDKEKKPYDTVTLNVDNNWKYTWEELPAGHKWTASEREVPEHYQVSVEEEGNIISITNEYTGPEVPPPPNIPQTGQLWWPVPLLAILGTVFFAIGWARRRDGEK
ncbi:MAG: Cna B-type domain-containing protein [Schaedlerella sp.]|nr:Cna B-type domain-containing protein [Schaedlerella sp.]